MTGRIPPDGLDPLSSALTDGLYLVQKSGNRFREWYRLIVGTGLTVTQDDVNHTIQIAAPASPLTPLITIVDGNYLPVVDSDGQIVYTEVQP